MASPARLVDSYPPADRQKPMEVLALGFSRTALKRALENLGYRVYHMEECVTRWQENHLHLFEEATRAKLLGQGAPWTGAELDKVLQNYTAIEDIPCLHFTDELLAYFPNAKVILTTRDIDSWQRSMGQAIFRIVNMKVMRYMSYIDPLLFRPYYSLLRLSVNKWTDGDLSNSKALRRSFTEHYANVRSKVPQERLLNFDPKDGWEPLCEFLEKPIPRDEPFPRVNDAASTVRLHYLIVGLRMWHIGRKYIGMLMVMGFAYVVARWTR